VIAHALASTVDPSDLLSRFIIAYLDRRSHGNGFFTTAEFVGRTG
jgi:hypothetical protein